MARYRKKQGAVRPTKVQVFAVISTVQMVRVRLLKEALASDVLREWHAPLEESLADVVTWLLDLLDMLSATEGGGQNG